MLGPKEGLSLINGTEPMQVLLALAIAEAELLIKVADLACAMSLDGLLGTNRAYDPRVIDIRPHPGQLDSAANLRALLAGSGLLASHRHDLTHAVQDSYCLRCAPQVHGAVRDLLSHVRRVVTIELGAVVDNPVIVRAEAGDGHEVMSTGNFHGQPLGFSADLLAMGLAELGSISERRTYRMLDPATSRGLPPFLAADPGTNSGFMIAQYTSASLVSENKVLTHPSSVDTIPTSGNQEDHVSMGWTSCRKLHDVVTNVRAILSVELLCAAQALDLRADVARSAPAIAAAQARLRDGGSADARRPRADSADRGGGRDAGRPRRRRRGCLRGAAVGGGLRPPRRPARDRAGRGDRRSGGAGHRRLVGGRRDLRGRGPVCPVRGRPRSTASGRGMGWGLRRLVDVGGARGIHAGCRAHSRPHRARRRVPGEPLPTVVGTVRWRCARPGPGAGAGQSGPVLGVLGRDGLEVVTASPELFLRRAGDVVESSPIKGTGRTAADLLPKDEAENVMIVDLVRNDLGRVCATGSIEVASLLEVEEHPGLVHLVSTVRGRLRSDAGWAQLLDATFPPGSVTGAPKSSALQILRELEQSPRGPYCGAIGWVDATHRTAELAVGIRTFWKSEGQLHFGTGAGITWGSDAAREWDETELKAAHLVALASKGSP